MKIPDIINGLEILLKYERSDEIDVAARVELQFLTVKNISRYDRELLKSFGWKETKIDDCWAFDK